MCMRGEGKRSGGWRCGGGDKCSGGERGSGRVRLLGVLMRVREGSSSTEEVRCVWSGVEEGGTEYTFYLYGGSECVACRGGG